MPTRRFLACAFLPFLAVLTCAAQAAPAARIVELKAADGTLLKASYFAAASPGPAVLLLHQCNMDRKAWDGLAAHMAAHGIHVLTVDNRGYGESGGARFAELPPQEMQRQVHEVWPGDFDVAFRYLLSQPGVERSMVGAGGASCGVNNSIQLARRHPEVKALALLSGETNREGRLFLQSSTRLPIFLAAAEDDEFGRETEIMQWLFSLSPNSANRFQRYAEGKHGAQMFGPHPELMDLITEWFTATLTKKPAGLPKTNGSPLAPEMMTMLSRIDAPGGADQVAQDLTKARQSNPKAQLFPEVIVNLLGYEHLEAGDAKGAVEILKLNAAAYPESPNVYDSLGDAYLASKQNELAAENAKKALELLASDTADPEEKRKEIRESAEQKLRH